MSGLTGYGDSAQQALVPGGAAAAAASTDTNQQVVSVAGGQQPAAAGKKRRRKAPVWQGPMGVSADVLMEATHGPPPPSGTAAAAGVRFGEGAAGEALASSGVEPAASTASGQQQPKAKKARLSRSAAAGVAAATIAAGATGVAVPWAGPPYQRQQHQRSVQGRAAVARRWAKYRAAKEGQEVAADSTDPAAVAAGAAGEGASQDVSAEGLPAAAPQEQAQKPLLLLPPLQGREFVADISVLNNVLVCVSDAMKLPEELLLPLPAQLVRALAAAGGAGTQDEEDTKVSAAAQLHAAVKAWYQQLCGAVDQRNGSMVAQLFEELGSKVLRVAC